MNKMKKHFSMTALLVTAALVLGGCYLPAAKRHVDRTGNVPWWCQGTPDLSASDCYNFSAALDLSIAKAHQYPTTSDAIAGALASTASPPGVTASSYVLNADYSAFNSANPNHVMYDSSSYLAGITWVVESGATPPEGFPGSRDVWTSLGGSPERWFLNVWALRGYENHPNIFATNHPCLTGPAVLGSTSDVCYLASHTVPMEIVVANDDGYFAHGIDAMVEGLADDPNDPNDPFVAGVNVTVVAPLTQQSGQGDNVTDGAGTAYTTGLFTDSGYPVEAAVHGTPADSVLVALKTLSLSPDIVMSGINEGQNMVNAAHLASGTVGAARTAARNGTNSLATSQGNPPSPDFPAGVVHTLALLEDYRLGRAGPPHMEVPNINIPSCGLTGTITGTVETVVGTSTMGRPYLGEPDCASAVDPNTFADDMDAYLNGWVGIADVGKDIPPNYP